MLQKGQAVRVTIGKSSFPGTYISPGIFVGHRVEVDGKIVLIEDRKNIVTLDDPERAAREYYAIKHQMFGDKSKGPKHTQKRQHKCMQVTGVKEQSEKSLRHTLADKKGDPRIWGLRK